MLVKKIDHYNYAMEKTKTSSPSCKVLHILCNICSLFSQKRSIFLYAQKRDMKRRIEVAADNRDAGNPLTISDVYLENNWRI